MRARSSTIAVVSLLTGCAYTITPPPSPTDPVSIFVLDYGRHASLALPATDEPVLVEYAYGDWNWFALDKSAWYDAFPTMLWPTQGALVRRRLDVAPTTAHLQRYLGCEEVLEITVSGNSATTLVMDLRRQFDDQIDTLHYQPLYDRDFVHADKSFHLLHTCNHAVADWLGDVGCRVRGSTPFADFEVDPD